MLYSKAVYLGKITTIPPRNKQCWLKPNFIPLDWDLLFNNVFLFVFKGKFILVWVNTLVTFHSGSGYALYVHSLGS